ncbi:MAG: DnaJ domain-containing protein [Bdellovibrionales bacterium]|nr:DnaJ domain-containing protein [Bdellovibrionales bacterium]
MLEISRGASKEQIKLAYKKLMSQYHPDKVAHLGADLQALAMKKTQEITWAYKQLQP